MLVGTFTGFTGKQAQVPVDGKWILSWELSLAAQTQDPEASTAPPQRRRPLPKKEAPASTVAVGCWQGRTTGRQRGGVPLDHWKRARESLLLVVG